MDLPNENLIQHYISRAIELSRENVQRNGGPFGAVIVLDGKIIGEGYNQVTTINDPTAHAEIVAIRNATKTTNNYNLQNSIIYSSCEPCPMCLAAIYWARIGALYYANTRFDAAKILFDDQFLYDEMIRPDEQRKIPTFRIKNTNAYTAFEEWMANPNKIEY